LVSFTLSGGYRELIYREAIQTFLRHWIASVALALTRKNHIASPIEAAAAILPCLGSGDTAPPDSFCSRHQMRMSAGLR
jgi:hypothetical protein